MSDIDFSFLKKYLQYDGNTGKFIWVKSPARVVKVGMLAGHVRLDGYISIQIKGRLYFAHRLAWLLTHGEWPKDQIDHINGNRADNRISNLREATRAQNGQNRRPNKGSETGVVGVTWSRKYGKWIARIMSNKKAISLGSFISIEDAIAARKAAETEMFTHANPH